MKPKTKPAQPTNKESVRRQNAQLFFDELIVSLTQGKHRWTPKERMWYNRVEAFLSKP